MGLTGGYGFGPQNCLSPDVPPGESCTIDITSNPSAPGTLTGTLTVGSNDPAGNRTACSPPKRSDVHSWSCRRPSWTSAHPGPGSALSGR